MKGATITPDPKPVLNVVSGSNVRNNNYSDNLFSRTNIDQNIVNSTEEIPDGVSIESASYMENNSDTKIDETVSAENNQIENTGEEESTPILFSNEQSQDNLGSENLDQNDESQQLFDQETDEDEDFEIPAFLRRQKF